MRRVWLSAGFLAGCAAPVDAEPRADGQPAETVAYVVTTRTLGASDRTAARAAFVRVSDARERTAVAKTLGLEPDLPDEGRCHDAEAASAAPVHAELIDAGEVWIGAGDHETKLVARAFPDLGYVSGRVYTTPDDALALGGAGASVRIRGGSGFGPRVVPLGSDELKIDGALTDGALTFARAGLDERTWVDVTDSLGSRRCTLPADATSFSLDADSTVTLHRDRRWTDGVITVRMETVEVVAPSVPSSGT